jgi:hypothetical protein
VTFTGSGSGLTNLQAGNVVGTFTNATFSTNSTSATQAALVVNGPQTNNGTLVMGSGNIQLTTTGQNIRFSSGLIQGSSAVGTILLQPSSGNNVILSFSNALGLPLAIYGLTGGSTFWEALGQGGTTNWVTPTGISVGQTITATNGSASYATNQLVTSTSTTISNSQSINMTVYITAATGLCLTNGLQLPVFTGQTVAAFTPFTLQPHGHLDGTAITCVGTNAW